MKQLLYFSAPHPSICLEGCENKHEDVCRMDLLAVQMVQADPSKHIVLGEEKTVLRFQLKWVIMGKYSPLNQYL